MPLNSGVACRRTSIGYLLISKVFWNIFYWPSLVYGSMDVILDNMPGHEYCDAEDFIAQCERGQVINMTFARYGRMAIGRCVTKNYGNMPCSHDALEYLHKNCSGRQNCTIGVPDKTLNKYNECPADFNVYLQAAYTCISVQQGSCQECSSGQGVTVRGQHGFISSSISKSMKSQRCPSVCLWRIIAQSGQRIKLTLHDYTKQSGSATCRTYAFIRQRGKPPLTYVCVGQQGGSVVKELLSSNNNSIDIEMQLDPINNNYGHILIEYQVIGCPYFEAPINTRVSYTSASATIICDQTEEKWVKKCLGTSWDGDLKIECPAAVPIRKQPISIPLGVLVAIIVGIALVIGVLILTIGLVWLKKQQHENIRMQEVYTYARRRESNFSADHDPATAPLRGPKPEGQIPGGKRGALPPLPYIKENVYMESRPLPSLPEEYAAREAAMMADRVQVHRTQSSEGSASNSDGPSNSSAGHPSGPSVSKPSVTSGPCTAPVSVHVKQPDMCAISTVPEQHSGRHTPDCHHQAQKPPKKPPPPPRLTPFMHNPAGGPPPRSLQPRPQQQQQQQQSPPPVASDALYFVLDPDAETGSQPSQTVFGAHVVPAACPSGNAPSSSRHKPPSELEKNPDDTSHSSCQDLPCNPRLQKLDPTKGNSSWP